MTTNQNDTNLLTDAHLDTVAAGSGYVKLDVGPVAEPRLGFVDVCDAGTALKRRGFVKNGCRGGFF